MKIIIVVTIVVLIVAVVELARRFSRVERPTSPHPGRPFRCPTCERDGDSKGCDTCWGWGWVRDEDPCEHRYRVVRQLGRGLALWRCDDCGHEREVDTSG